MHVYVFLFLNCYRAIHNPDPVMRLLMLTKWYISGFYIMPKTPKKPYNPIIGETFRCKWEHPASAHGPASNSFLICEQVSHHPPVSAIYAGNRADGWVVNGSILFKSKFWGMSAGCLLDGYATMYVPEFGEEYRIGFPSAVAKGFIVGPLTMEMFGEVTIECKATGLVSTIEFKTKPSFRGEFNCVGGSLKRIGSGEVLYEYSGRYDREVFYKDPKSDVKNTLWKVTPGLENTRLPRYTIPFDEQDAFASERLWDKVTKSLIAGDQAAATEEKTRIEELQRQIHRDLEAKGEQWKTKFFDYDAEAKEWVYKWLDKTKLDMKADVGEYDADGRIVPLERSKALKAFEAAPPMLLITESDDDDDDNNDGDVDGDDDEEDDDEEEEGLDNNNNNNPKTKERLAKLRKQIAANNTKLNGLKAKIRDQEAAIAMLKSGAGCVKTGDDSAKRVSSAYTTVLGLVLLLMIIMFFRK